MTHKPSPFRSRRPEFDDEKRRIQGLTELEALYALQVHYLGEPGGISPDKLLMGWGDYPRTRTILQQFTAWKAEYENPDLYWDEVIANFGARLEEARENKRKGTKPPLARY